MNTFSEVFARLVDEAFDIKPFDCEHCGLQYNCTKRLKGETLTVEQHCFEPLNENGYRLYEMKFKKRYGEKCE